MYLSQGDTPFYPIFVDCTTVPDPDSEQLSDIAITSAELFLGILRIDPAVVFVSFSTYGSAKHRLDCFSYVKWNFSHFFHKYFSSLS